MGRGWTKFVLLTWKNWTLQRRHPIQTAVEILAPVLLASLLVLIRSLVTPETIDKTTCYRPFPADYTNGSLFSSNEIQRIFTPIQRAVPPFPRNNWVIAWSPDQEPFREIMNIAISNLNDTTNNVTFMSQPFKNQKEMYEVLTYPGVYSPMEIFLAGVAFDDSISILGAASNDFISIPENVQMTIRFPAELRRNENESDWRTHLLFPGFQGPGPRSRELNQGGYPGYWHEGFLILQHFISLAIIQNVSNSTEIPEIMLQRFPYPPFTHDDIVEALRRHVPLLMMVSFVYTCINTVKVITVERERQLKEAMKIMGLPNWLHWTAWFLKTFMFMMISVILIVICLTVQWYPGTDRTVFSFSDPSLLLVYFMVYIIASICFFFLISVLFSKANTASLMAAVLWFVSYVAFMFMSEQYENLTLAAKLSASLLSNSAMAFGFLIFLMYEGTEAGMQWCDFWTPVTLDDDLVLGHIFIMLLVDALIYLLLALYIEAVFPGEFGVPKPWYFPFQPSFWCEKSHYKTYFDTAENQSNDDNSGVCEKEPSHLPAGVRIKHLRKVYNKKVAVKDLTLNMYEGHITVLLGHNGAGKTTTLSMLTGMITPTSGTALVGGFDIRTDIQKVRESLGLCPQHNVLFEELTVREHLYFFGKLKGLTGDALNAEIKKYISLLELEPKENAESSTLSGGMKRKLAAGVALCGGSKIVMFDEPTSGLDPAARRALWDLLQAEKHGRTTLLTTHFMDEADLLGDRIAIMSGGELQCCGSSFFLKKKYGAGYHLIIVKGPNCDVNSVTRLLHEFIPDLSVNQNIGSELSYLLNEDHSSVFEAMLSKLEENKKHLGLLSYGVSLTTMEEVFMKVGRDTEVSPSDEQQQSNGIDNVAYSGSVEIGDCYTLPNGQKLGMPLYSLLNGRELVMNQLTAMIIKKALYMWRMWYITLIQILMPAFFLILTIIIVHTWQRIPNLPPLTVDLAAYGETFTPVEVKNEDLDNVASVYTNLTGGIKLDKNDTMSDYMLKQSEIDLQKVRQHYIVGATFGGNGTAKTITGWFNNLPYHSIPLAVGTIYNALLKCLTNTSTSITVVNHPLPYSDDSLVPSQSFSTNNMGFQVAFNLGFSMAFVSAFFMIFYVKERVSKAKHLQIVSGVEVVPFWLSALVWDLLFSLLPIVGVIITFVGFQEDGFSTGEELGRIVIVLICFFWSVLPATCLLSFVFSVPLTGFTRMAVINVITGIALFMTVNILQLPRLELQDVAEVLDWIFLIFPHYSLCASINSMYNNYVLNKACSALEKMNPQLCIQEHLCCKQNCPPSGCVARTDNYFDWEAPGIGRNILFFMWEGAVSIVVLLMVEFRLFERLLYSIQKSDVKIGTDNNKCEEELDSDVAAEKLKLVVTDTSVLRRDYELVLKDVTKYYGNFLAVNKLNLGVKRGECFGLLGVNGAGKTSTFKMMTGDEKISAGEAYVSGLSLKTSMKEVHQRIGYCPQFDAVLEDLTGKETLTMFCLLRGVPKKKCPDVINYLAGELLFKKHINKKVKEYSGGNKRKLSTAIALIGDPPVIYLDEPTTGMDPGAKRHLWNVICKVRDSGKCIILTSHSMEECEALCTRLAIMVNGHFKCLGSTQHLKNKFAKGFTLIVKIRKVPVPLVNGIVSTDHSISAKEVESYDLQPVREFIVESFPGAILMEEYEGLLTYCISNPTLTWSRMFGMMERAKRQLNIEDYSLGQTSLEQVFLTFTKKQRED